MNAWFADRIGASADSSRNARPFPSDDLAYDFKPPTKEYPTARLGVYREDFFRGLNGC